MISLVEVLSLVLVGALWGCTNPLLREGSKDDDDDEREKSDATNNNKETPAGEKSTKTVFQSLIKFRNFRVWVPYALNQVGSVLYYFTLANSSLSLAVPICNGLSLVFSILTSHWLGERVDKPVRAIVGSALVVGGVALCLATTSNRGDGKSE